MENIPIYSQWQVTYDGISVRSDRRIFPFPSPEPNLVENIFQPTHFNSEQVAIFQEMVQNLSLNGTLLQEDFHQLLKLCQTNVGPYGQVYHRPYHQPIQQQQGELKVKDDDSVPFDSILFPKLWRIHPEDLSKSFNEVMNMQMDGTKEVQGIITQEKVMELIQQFGKEKESLLNHWTGGI